MTSATNPDMQADGGESVTSRLDSDALKRGRHDG